MWCFITLLAHLGWDERTGCWFFSDQISFDFCSKNHLLNFSVKENAWGDFVRFWKTDIFWWVLYLASRSSHWKWSIKKLSLKTWQNSQENTCARVSLFNKVAVFSLQAPPQSASSEHLRWTLVSAKLMKPVNVTKHRFKSVII